MKQIFTRLKICIIFLIMHEYTSLGLKLRAKRDHTEQSNETLLFTRLEPDVPSKKWQIGRVTRKQYEVINMIWRRTNIFVDVDNIPEIERTTTTKHHSITKSSKDIKSLKDKNSKHKQKLYSLPMFQYPTPPSYIEFFYLEEITSDENNNVQTTPMSSQNFEKYFIPRDKPSKELIVKKLSSPSPRLIFQLYDSLNQTNINQNAKRNPRKNDKKENNDLSLKSLSKIIVQSYKNNKIFNEKTFVENDNTDMSRAELSNDMLLPTKIPSKEVIEASSVLVNVTSTKNYDRVKFFDIYDSVTEEPSVDTSNSQYIDSRQESIPFETKPTEYNNSSTETPKVKIKSTKKNISSAEIPKVKNITPRSLRNMTNSTVHTEKIKSMDTVIELKKDSDIQFPPKLAPRRSKSVNWTEYPYVAAYIYDRYKVHCDAAVISAHWLMAAGSCLSRHSDEPIDEGRSAFVTYCGNTWWNPERITYVKYSVVHPMFNPRDRSRKYLYNIGLIQVVTSMASACSIWEPVILMSYHYIGSDDSVAVAVGWGLDRYGVKYSSSDLPKRPLSVYAGSVYSDSCPGNSGYLKALDENDDGLRNVYCLALPNYSREDWDPLHGGLLVVGGKLIALFLQEERRMQGDQAAEYTGVWRLLPWVTEVAREPEDTDFSLL